MLLEPPFECASDDEVACEGDEVAESEAGSMDDPVAGDLEETDVGLVMVLVVLRFEVEMNRLSGGGCGFAGVGVTEEAEEGCPREGGEWDESPLTGVGNEEDCVGWVCERRGGEAGTWVGGSNEGKGGPDREGDRLVELDRFGPEVDEGAPGWW